MVQEQTLVVVDASVVLKWQFNDEESILQAASLRDDYYVRGTVKAIAPQLLTYEVVNGLITAVKRKRISSNEAVQAMGNFLALGIELRAVEALRLTEIALNSGLTAYDAAYLALAEDEQCDLWTGDGAFYKAVKGSSPRVKWIGDYTGEGRT